MEPLTVLAFAVSAAFLMWVGAFIYQRGVAKASVMPAVVDRLINPPPKPAQPDKPICPAVTCPFCKQRPRWILSDDWSEWTCTKCERSISGPKPKILP